MIGSKKVRKLSLLPMNFIDNFQLNILSGTRGFWVRVRVGSGFTRGLKIELGSSRVIHFRVGFFGFRVPAHPLLDKKMDNDTFWH